MLERKSEAKIKYIRNEYRLKIKELEGGCLHDFTDWYPTPNEDFRYDPFGRTIIMRDCLKCGKRETGRM